MRKGGAKRPRPLWPRPLWPPFAQLECQHRVAERCDGGAVSDKDHSLAGISLEEAGIELSLCLGIE